MSNIPKLTTMDKTDLAFAAAAAVEFNVGHWYDIMNIASRLCNGDPGAAFKDIMETGLQELGIICDMDEDAVRRGL